MLATICFFWRLEYTHCIQLEWELEQYRAWSWINLLANTPSAVALKWGWCKKISKKWQFFALKLHLLHWQNHYTHKYDITSAFIFCWLNSNGFEFKCKCGSTCFDNYSIFFAQRVWVKGERGDKSRELQMSGNFFE